MAPLSTKKGHASPCGIASQATLCYHAGMPQALPEASPLAHTLAAALHSRRWTTGALCAALRDLGHHYDRGTVHRWVTGSRTPSLEACRALADALGLAGAEREAWVRLVWESGG